MNSFFPESSSVVSQQGSVNSSMKSLKFKPEHWFKKLRSIIFKEAMNLKIAKTKRKYNKRKQIS